MAIFVALFMATTALSNAETITGTVRAASDSTALEGVTVYWLSNDVRMDSTTTDALGVYTFADVSTGFIPVQAERDGYVMGSGNAFFFGSTEATVNFYLGRPASLIGTVNQLSDSTPLANALVLLRQGNNDNSAILDSTRTDATGSYAFNGLSSSTTAGFFGNEFSPYRIYASATGMVNTSVTGITLDFGDTVATDLYLGAAATISGTVRQSSDNSVLEGAEVSLRRGSATGAALQTTTTDALGHYEFTDVAPGSPDYWVSAGYEGLATATNAAVAVGSGAAVVSDLSLEGIVPGSISGTVRTTADSTIVPGAKIYLRRGNANSEALDSAVSDALGAFKFEDLEAEAPAYVLTASVTGLASVTVSNILVHNGGDTAVGIYLPTLGGISGTVRKVTDSTAIANALVLLRRGNSDDAAILDSTRTDASGHYAFTDLAASTGGFGGQGTQYRVYASASGYATASNTGITVSNGTTVTSNLYLGAPGTLSGTVLALPDSAPVANAKVQLLTGGFFGTVVDSTVTNEEGEYSFTQLSAGSDYQIAVTAEGYSNITKSGVVVTSGSDATYEIVLSPVPRGTIYGTVIKASDSTAFANVLVVLRRGSETGEVEDSVRSDVDGKYAFDGILAGTPNYWVTASATGYTSATQADVVVGDNDSTRADFALAAVVSITGNAPSAAQAFTVRRAGNGWLIRVSPATTPRTFTIHDVRGALMFRTRVPAGAVEIRVPTAATHAGVMMRLN